MITTKHQDKTSAYCDFSYHEKITQHAVTPKVMLEAPALTGRWRARTHRPDEWLLRLQGGDESWFPTLEEADEFARQIIIANDQRRAKNAELKKQEALCEKEAALATKEA